MMKKIFFVNFTHAIRNLSPLHCMNSNEANIIATMFRGLYKMSGQSVVFDLIEEEHVDDLFQVWTLKIKEAFWSNGQLVTVTDFQNTWETLLKYQMPTAELLLKIKGAKQVYEGKSQHLEGIEVLDNRSIRIHLEYSTPAFREITCYTAFSAIYPTDPICEYTFSDWINGVRMVTNGSYQLHEWGENRVEVVAVQPEVEIERICFTFCSDQAELVRRFESGTLDLHDGGPQDDSELARRLSEYLRYYPFLSSYFLFFNTRHRFFDTEAFRRQLSTVIPRREIVHGSEKTPTRYLVPREFAEWDRMEEDTTNGMEDQLSVTDWAECQLTTNLKFITNDESTYYKMAYDLIKRWREKLGIEIELEILSWGEFYQKLQLGDFDIARGGMIAQYADAFAFFEPFSTTSGFNFGGWKDLRYNELLNEVRRTGDRSCRIELYKQLESRLLEAAPILPIYTHYLRQMVGRRMKCLNISPTGLIDYQTLAFN